jgi:hypothetical protein
MKKKIILLGIAYCVFVSPLNAQHIYYVATDGDDNNPGTIAQPWATWQKAVLVSVPGDTTYIRGGVYQPTTHIMVGSYETGTIGMIIDGNAGASGTAEAPICYFAYPPDWNAGNVPILDGSLVGPNTATGWNVGIDINNAQYIHLKGLTVRHIHQGPPDFDRVGKPYSEALGIAASLCANLVFENVVSHDIDGRGFQHWGGAWSDMDAQYAVEAGFQTEYMPPIFGSDTTRWINCDAYNLFDQYSTTPGNSADGFITTGYYGNHFYWEGCRAWNYSDDGFNPNGSCYHTFKNCWAMSTDTYENISPDWDIEGNGFKLPAVNTHSTPDYVLGEINFYTVENCIAAYCVGSGFATNLFVDYNAVMPNNSVFYNNFAYKNGAGYFDFGYGGGTRSSIYRNNIAYESTDTGWVMDPLYEVAIYRPSVYDESHNTWIATNLTGDESWPGWEYNPAVAVTDADFVSLDASQLSRPRKSDGSLPDITFGHLKNGSDLIDAGIDVGLPFNGNAPDIGAFEYIPSTGTITNHGIPKEFLLHQNYPNPFNPSTVISYDLSAVSNVRLGIYDLLGREIALLVNEIQNAGIHQAQWNAAGMASGIYFYRITTGSFIATKKLMLLR